MEAGGKMSICSLREAIDRLRSPYGREEFATLTGCGVLIVDLPIEEAPSSLHAEVEVARRALRELACPTIALRAPEISSLGAALVDAFDVVLEAGDGGRLNALLQCVEAHPRASLGLVQLLRHGEGLSIHEGLIAESLVYSMLQSGAEFQSWLETRSPGRPQASDASAVLIEREGDRLDLILNRPERHNAFGLALRDGLVEGLQLAASDSKIAEIVLRGAGPSFCSGGDLDEFGDFPDPATAHAVRSVRNPARLLSALAPRTRARVHGACIGAGVELPAFVSRVVAAESAFFQLPEVGMGLVPGAGGTVSLPRRIGRQRSAWLALTGERIDAQQALAWGLVDAVVSDGEFFEPR